MPIPFLFNVIFKYPYVVGVSMSERSEVIQREVGYLWRITIKKTTRQPKEGSKYDDVTETEVSFAGHENAEQFAYEALERARVKATEAV